MKKTRRDWIPFSFYDHTGMEKHLEKMAQKGWMLEELTSFGWKYREIQPQKLHFSVSFDTRASEFEPEPTEEQYTFQEFCQRSGWKLAAASGQMQVFYNEEEDPLPIQTDPEMEVRMVGKLARRMVPAYLILLVLGFFVGGSWCYSLIHTPIKLLTTPGSTFMGLCWLGLFVYSITDLITYFAWRRRALAAAQRGEFLPTRGCHKLMYVVLGMIVLGLMYWLATERRPGMRLVTGGILLAYVVVFLSVNGTKRILKRRKASAGVNRAITLSLDVILSVILVGTVMFLFIRGLQSGANSMEQEIRAPLSASELTGVDEEKYLTTVSTDMSLFLDRKEVQCRTGFDQMTEVPWMNYILVEIHIPILHDACFQELCREKEKRIATYVDGSIVHAQYQMVDPTPWGAEEAYQLNLAGEFRQEYILCWKDRIVQLGAGWDLTAEQMAVAGEKLLNA